MKKKQVKVATFKKGRDPEAVSPSNTSDLEKVSYKTFEYQKQRMSRTARFMHNTRRATRVGRVALTGSVRKKKV